MTMITPETFRYLASSLVQVFGALLAVDAVFLVVWYESVQRRLETLESHTFLLVSSLELYNQTIDPIEDPSGYRRAEHNALALRALSRIDVRQRIARALEKVRAMISALDATIAAQSAEGRSTENIEVQRRLFRESLDHVIGEVERYDRTLQELSRLPTFLWKAMALPAALGILFAVFLAFTDLAHSLHLLGSLALVSIVAAGIGFALLTVLALSMFELEGPGELTLRTAAAKVLRSISAAASR